MTKLFLETYIDILLAVALNFTAIYQSETMEDFVEFFNSFDNFLSSGATIVFFGLIIAAPLYISYLILANYDKLDDPEFQDKYGVYYNEFKTN